MDGGAHSPEVPIRTASDDNCPSTSRVGSRLGSNSARRGPCADADRSMDGKRGSGESLLTVEVIERSDGRSEGAKLRELDRRERRRQKHECKVFTEPVFFVRRPSEGCRRRARILSLSGDDASRALPPLSDFPLRSNTCNHRRTLTTSR